MSWYVVPPGADGMVMAHATLPVRYLVGGLIRARDRYRGVDVLAEEIATSLAEATRIAIGLVLTIDMQEDARRELEARERDRRRGYTRDRVADRDVVRELRRRLDDPARVVHALGLEKGARRQPRGVTVLCPWHDERTPSCSVRVADDGTIACRCHGCGATADVLGLVAAVHGLDPRREFRRVLETAAAIAGVTLARAS